MSESVDIGPQTPNSGVGDGSVPSRRDSGPSPVRTLLFVGLAAASVSIAAIMVRAAFRQTPSDPTTERIQALIDEANRLLRALDEQKNS